MWTYITTFSSTSIAKLEQLNVYWVFIVFMYQAAILIFRKLLWYCKTHVPPSGRKVLFIYKCTRSLMFYKIDALKIFTKFTGKYLCRSFFLIKLQAGGLWQRCFSVNFEKLLRIFLGSIYIRQEENLKIQEVLCQWFYLRWNDLNIKRSGKHPEAV